MSGPTSTYRHWCDADESRFVAMFAQGKSYEEIGAALNRTPDALKTRACKVLAARLSEVRGQRKKAISAALRVRVGGRVPVVAAPAPVAASQCLSRDLPRPIAAHTFTAEQDERLRDYMAQDMGLGGAAALLRIPRAAVAARWAALQMAGAA
jgi:hypothetical protein